MLFTVLFHIVPRSNSVYFEFHAAILLLSGYYVLTEATIIGFILGATLYIIDFLFVEKLLLEFSNSLLFIILKESKL